MSYWINFYNIKPLKLFFYTSSILSLVRFYQNVNLFFYHLNWKFCQNNSYRCPSPGMFCDYFVVLMLYFNMFVNYATIILCYLCYINSSLINHKKNTFLFLLLIVLLFHSSYQNNVGVSGDPIFLQFNFSECLVFFWKQIVPDIIYYTF